MQPEDLVSQDTNIGFLGRAVVGGEVDGAIFVVGLAVVVFSVVVFDIVVAKVVVVVVVAAVVVVLGVIFGVGVVIDTYVVSGDLGVT